MDHYLYVLAEKLYPQPLDVNSKLLTQVEVALAEKLALRVISDESEKLTRAN